MKEGRRAVGWIYASGINRYSSDSSGAALPKWRLEGKSQAVGFHEARTQMPPSTLMSLREAFQRHRLPQHKYLRLLVSQFEIESGANNYQAGKTRRNPQTQKHHESQNSS